MNLFWREIKSHRNSLIGWCVGMLFLIVSSMAKYAAYSGNGQSMNDIIKQFPKSFMTIFGVGGFDLSHISGYFGVIFLYISLMAAIHAVLIGSDIIAKEERERTSEFLYVKPISRARAITSKLLAALSNIIILNLFTLVVSLKVVPQYAKGESVSHELYVLMVGLFFIQLIFLSIGSGLAGISREPKTVSGLATSVLLVTYAFYIVINVNDKLEWLKYLSPFKYFDAKNLIDSGHLEPSFVVLSILIALAFTAGTYIFYQKRDLKV